jgi:hypothetical protein
VLLHSTALPPSVLLVSPEGGSAENGTPTYGTYHLCML